MRIETESNWLQESKRWLESNRWSETNICFVITKAKEVASETFSL